ncbi:MAG: hypothetical protein KDD64_00340 [Bdellovibrionales bacterium]|nr:hypothetical protein [Bdellovibrionales bacterium]
MGSVVESVPLKNRNTHTDLSEESFSEGEIFESLSFSSLPDTESDEQDFETGSGDNGDLSDRLPPDRHDPNFDPTLHQSIACACEALRYFHPSHGRDGVTQSLENALAKVQQHLFSVEYDLFPLHEAFDSIRSFLEDYTLRSEELDPRIEFERRVGWIQDEVALFFDTYLEHCTLDSDEHEQAAERVVAARRYFKEDLRGRPHGWREEVDPQGLVSGHIAHKNLIRQLGAELFRFGSELARDDLQEASVLRSCRIFQKQLDRLKSEIQLKGSALSGLIDIFSESMVRIHRATGPFLPSLAREVFRQMDSNYQKIATQCLPEVRYIKDAIGLGESSDLRMLYFSSEQNFPPIHLLEKIEDLEKGLLIDLDRKAPQEGYGRVLPVSELKEVLSCSGAHLICLTVNGEVNGFFIALSDPSSMPLDVVNSLEKISEAGLDKHTQFGWGEIVGISKRARAFCRSVGVNAYEALTNVVRETAFQLRMDQLFGEVREGIQANTAKAKHLAQGWEETGLFRFHGNIPYQILRLPLYSVLPSAQKS